MMTAQSGMTTILLLFLSLTHSLHAGLCTNDVMDGCNIIWNNIVPKALSLRTKLLRPVICSFLKLREKNVILEHVIFRSISISVIPERKEVKDGNFVSCFLSKKLMSMIIFFGSIYTKIKVRAS